MIVFARIDCHQQSVDAVIAQPIRSRYPHAIECACIRPRWIRSARDLERKHRSTQMEGGCRKFHTRASLPSCRARLAPRGRLAGRRGPRHCRCMTTSSLWSRRTRILNKSSGSSLTRRISENWRQRAPYSSACSPRSTIVKATISGCSQAAIRTSAFAIRSRARSTTPDYPFKASSLGEQLIAKGLSFKGYSESLPGIGSTVEFDPPNCRADQCIYARKHVPWISFANVPNGTTIDTSSNLRFADFPSDYATLPTVAFVIPNLNHDMHNGKPAQSIP